MTKRDTRSAILDAAIGIMGQEGYEGLSASRLAKAAGISKSNLFHHFPAIGEVPIAAFDRMAGAAAGSIPDPAASVLDIVKALGEATFAVLDTNRPFVAAYMSYLTRAMFDPALSEKVAASLDATQAAIAEALAEKAGSAQEARALADLAVALLDGAAAQFLVHGDAAQMRRMWTRFLSLVEKEYPDADRD